MDEHVGRHMQRRMYTRWGHVLIRVMLGWLVLLPLSDVSQRAPREARSLHHLVTALLHGMVEFAYPREAHATPPPAPL